MRKKEGRIFVNLGLDFIFNLLLFTCVYFPFFSLSLSSLSLSLPPSLSLSLSLLPLQPLCDNHDDGETKALILCDVCGNLCGECDRVLHYHKKNHHHNRQVSKGTSLYMYTM